jgi:DNA-binding transcriptional regulator of glucitol operon
LLTPKWLVGHALVWVGVAAFLALGWWQAGRAAEGNVLSWAYTFEWPLFAIFLVYMWIREMRLALGRAPAEKPRPAKRGPVITRQVPAAAVEDDPADPKLAEYNRMLAWLSEHPEARPSDYRV